MLGARLAALAARVRPGSRVADIGTDHAYLPIALVEQGICPCAVASDIRSGPVLSAREHIAAAGLEKQITVRQGDGLKVFDPEEIDDIVVAGMGGEMIAAILAASPFVRHPRYHLLLQPMSRAEKLREYLMTNGYSLCSESVICEGNRLYNIIEAEFTDAEPIFAPAAYYIGALPPDTPDRYWKRLCTHLEHTADGLTVRGCQAAGDHLRDLIHTIRVFQQEGIRPW